MNLRMMHCKCHAQSYFTCIIFYLFLTLAAINILLQCSKNYKKVTNTISINTVGLVRTGERYWSGSFVLF